ncbi:hypothetical protein ACI2LF_29695 [Kribbella sp. NPDC020789]
MFDHLFAPAPDLSYRPNKLHGDELVVGKSHVYTQAGDEWLTADEVEQVLRAAPATPLVVFDGWTLHRFAAPANWRPHYISDDGYPPAETGVGPMAYLWTDSGGGKLLLFQIDC